MESPIINEHNFQVYEGDCIKLMQELDDESVNMIFADPPYFLSNGGTTCKSGSRVSVIKGKWDKLKSVKSMNNFNRNWLKEAQKLLTPNGTIWVSGTHHNIYSIGSLLQLLGFKILNEITWEKPNPPPNLSCRYFTHSTETIIWAAKSSKSKHIFNYQDMKAENGGKQMKSVWSFTAPKKNEKEHGKHPTQKPIELLNRIIRASTLAGDLVLDPFNGSGTTGIAAYSLGRRYIGIEKESKYIDITRYRFEAQSSL